MPVEMLTYAELGERLKVSPEAARALVKRHRWPRSRSNDGKTLVQVDLREQVLDRRRAQSGLHPAFRLLAQRVLEQVDQLLQTAVLVLRDELPLLDALQQLQGAQRQ